VPASSSKEAVFTARITRGPQARQAVGRRPRAVAGRPHARRSRVIDEKHLMGFDVDDFAREIQQEIVRDVRRKYSKVVMHHWMHPVNFRRMDKCDGYGRVTGSCGDTIEIFIKVDGERITDCSFFTDGCGTTIASASVAVTLAKGKSILQATQVNKKSILDACGGLPEDHVHCAELAANALQYAIIDFESSCFRSKREET
jgi:nitrogen fixation NifU-like protein